MYCGLVMMSFGAGRLLHREAAVRPFTDKGLKATPLLVMRRRLIPCRRDLDSRGPEVPSLRTATINVITSVDVGSVKNSPNGWKALHQNELMRCRAVRVHVWWKS
jgi:hypothetical protein